MSLHHLFRELNARLLLIQSPVTRGETYSFGDYYELFLRIEEGIGSFSEQEYVPEVQSYLGKVERLIQAIIEAFPSESSTIKRPIKLKVLEEVSVGGTDSAQQEIPDEIYFLEELEYYRDRFLKILSLNTSSRSDAKRVFLPENFTVADVKEHVPNPIKVKTLANFFYILQRSGHIAPLDAKPLATLLLPLFGASVQTFREAYGLAEHEHRSKKDLKELKEFLTKVQEEVNQIEPRR